MGGRRKYTFSSNRVKLFHIEYRRTRTRGRGLERYRMFKGDIKILHVIRSSMVRARDSASNRWIVRICKMPFYYLVNKMPYHSNTDRRKSIIPTYLYVLKTSSHGEFFIEYHRITIDSGLPRAFEVACRP